MRKLIMAFSKYRWGIVSWLLVMPLLLFASGERAKEIAFARILCDREALVEGDSCMITFALFSYYPFDLLEKPTSLKVKNGEVRALPIGRQRLQRVLENGQAYYVRVLEQYVLKTKHAGVLTVPSRNLKIKMEVPVREVDPLEEMFGVRVPVKCVEHKVGSREFRLNVKEKPKRTMMEMHNSGLQVL